MFHFFFFFSSRRRHTRWPRDWSSDVCSSDLAGGMERTVLAEALSGYDQVWELEAELERLADAMARPGADPTLTERYGELQHRFEALGGYRLEAEAKMILGGLGFASGSVHRGLGEFSGGWRMRAALARLLLLRP